MADDADLAQESYEMFVTAGMEERRRAREAELRPENLPPCENYDDCGRRAFVTEKGTVAKFCKPCWEEYRAGSA